MNELEKALGQIDGILAQIKEANEALRWARKQAKRRRVQKTCHDCELHDRCAECATEDGWEGDADDCFDFIFGGYRQEKDGMLLAKEKGELK